MSIHLERFDRRDIDPELKKLELWPTVDLTMLTEMARKRYLRLEGVVRSYLVEDSLVDEIAQTFNIHRSEITRIIKRCLRVHSDGTIWGFRALVPYMRQKEYEVYETTVCEKGELSRGYAGQLGLLFSNYPDIKKLVDDLLLKIPREDELHEPRIRITDIHNRFIDACRKAHIKNNHYPFCATQRARTAIANYATKKFDDEFAKAVRARYGKDAGRKIQIGLMNKSDENPVTRPLERVEFDAHRIDLIGTVLIPSTYGGWIEHVVKRIWILVIIDVLTKCILGYHFCFSKEYSANDVLICIKNAVVPWKSKELTIPGLKYHQGAGMPSAIFEELQYAIWDEFSYDNAKANLADRVVTLLTTRIGCAVNPGAIGNPNKRKIIEKFFDVLEENGFHRIPSTTGNNPRDPRRNRPEAAALKHHIRFEEIVELTDVLIANYNNQPQTGMGGRSPLEYLDFFINSNGWIPRNIPKNERQNLQLFNIQVEKKVAGSIKNTVIPHIYFEGVKYRNDVLSRSPALIGVKLTLSINPEDPRSLRAYLPNGAELGVLTGIGPWGRWPHTLQQRKAILHLARKKLLYFGENEDPLPVYLRYLAQSTSTKKSTVRDLAQYQHDIASSVQSLMPQLDPTKQEEEDFDDETDLLLGETESRAPATYRKAFNF